MFLLFAYLSLALGVSFICSILEAVLLSTPMSFISMKEQEGAKGIARLKNQKQNIDGPISAILSLNTIAHTVGAAGVGAQAVKLFGDVYFGITSAVLTLLILVLSEIIPKTIGATYWRGLAIPSAKLINILMIICYPFVFLSEMLSKLVSTDQQESFVSREEVSAMVNEGVREGVIKIKESKIIQNIMKLGYIKVKEIMTPRIVTSIASENMTLREFYEDKSYWQFSRIPLYDENNRDYITGYVLRQRVLENLTEDKFDVKLNEIKRPITTVTESDSVSLVWEKLLAYKEHIAVVIDEYGCFDGIVTMEDIVETILGLEIIDEKDTVVDMQQLAREKWKDRMAKYQYLKNS